MPGDTPTGDDAQALWDEVAKEREAGLPPSDAKPDAEFTAADADDAQDDESKTEDTGDDAAATAEAKETGATEAEADPYEGLSPALKARLEKLEDIERQAAQIPQLVQRVNTAEGRVAAMQRERDVARRAAQAVTVAPTQAQISAASGSLEKWDTLKSEFPEWAEATDQYVTAKLAGLSPQQVQGVDPEKIAELIEQRVGEARAEMAKAVEEAKLEGKYGDWKEVINTDEFLKWFNVQSPETQGLARSEKGRDAIRMLDLFHEAKAKPAEAVIQERKNKLAAAVTSKPGSTAAVVKTVDEMSQDELWEYERKQAAKRGRDRGLTY